MPRLTEENPLQEKIRHFIIAQRAIINKLDCLNDIPRMDPHNYRWLMSEGLGRDLAAYGYSDGADFNVGVSRTHIRAGLVFDFLRHLVFYRVGVSTAFNNLRRIVELDTDGFTRFAQVNRIEIECLHGQLPTLEVIATDRVIQWLLSPLPDNVRLIYIGRILKFDRDREILETPILLINIIKSVFSGLRPFFDIIN